MPVAEDLVHQAEQHGWTGALPPALRLLALCCINGGDRDRARPLLARARTLAAEAQDPLEEGRVLWTQARGVLLGGDADLGHELALQARSRLEAGGGDPLWEAMSDNQLGMSLKRRGDRAGGHAHLVRAREAFDGLGHAFGGAETRQALAVLAQQRGDLTGAAVLVDEALALQERAGSPAGLSRCLNLVGELHRQRGELEEAECAYRRALETAAAAGLAREVWFPRLNLAQVLQRQGHHAEAIALFETVLADPGLGDAIKGCLHGVLLESLEVSGHVADWESHHALAKRLLHDTRTDDVDVAHGAERSGQWAAQCWRDGRDPAARSRATRALGLAWRTWSGLGREGDVARVVGAIEALGAEAGPTPLGEFDLIEVVGQGAMGTVWAARHRASGEPAAVKVLRGSRARDPRVLAGFRTEVRALAGLDHPAVAWILGQGVVEPPAAWASGGLLVAGSPYLALEFAGGGSLVGLAGKLTWTEIRALLTALLGGLAHAHGRGVLHRDLKPANVMLGDGPTLGEQVRLVDFGLAVAGGGEGLGHTAAGTPGYMAPEQFQAAWRDQGPWTDLYALGCLATELVQGSPPFVAGTRSELQALHRFADVPPLRPAVPVPDGIEAWLCRLLAKAPADRFSSAAGAALALRAMGEVQGVPTVEPARLTHATAATTWFAESQEPEPRGVGAPSPMAPLADAGVPEAPPPDPPPRALLAGPGASLFGLRTPRLVGRQVQVRRLWGALRQVAETGRAHGVLLTGPAGVGRSRLGSWFANKVRACGAAVVGESRFVEGQPPGRGFRQLVEPWLGVRGLERDRAYERLGSLLIGGTRLGPELVDDLVRVVARDPDSARVDQRFRVALGLRLISRAASTGPVVLWLDDVQWSQATLGFAERVLRAGQDRDLPVLVVAGLQDEALAEAPGARQASKRLLALSQVEHLPVPPLSDRDLHELLRAVVGLAPKPARQLVQRAGGSPQLALHVVADLVERGLLVRGPQGVDLQPGRSLTVPAGLLEVWQGRVERVSQALGGQAREALELAAVLGQDVVLATWQRACGIAGVQIPEGLLDALFDLHLASPDGGRWRFTNSLLRESLQRSAAAQARSRGWHAACAEALDAAGGAAYDRGLHRHRAGQHEAAVTLLLDAMTELRNAGLRGRSLVAGRWATEALDAQGAPEHDPRRLRCRLEWLLAERDATGFAGTHDAATAIAETAAAGGHQALASRAWLAGGNAARHMGEYDLALTLIEQGRLGYEALGDVTGLIRAHRALAGLARVRGDLDRAWDHLQRCMALAPQIRGWDGQLGLWYSLALVAYQRDDFASAESLFRQCLEIAREQGARGVVASCLNGLADIARRRGDHEGAARGFREAMALNRELGAPGYVMAALNLAQALLALGRRAAAHDGFGEVLEGLTRQGRQHLLVVPELGLLATAPARVPPAQFGAALERIESSLAASGFADRDIAELAEAAGWRAHELGARGQAERVWQVAVDHWGRLERDARQAAVQGWQEDLRS